MNTAGTGYVYDPIFLKHTRPGHPENDRRLEAIMQELTSSGLLEFLRQTPSREASVEELASVHQAQYIERIQAISKSGGGNLDPDTYTTANTYTAAAVAAGSMIDLTLNVCDETLENGFACLRPPGHHALPARGMGFCIFNNVAIAAKIAQTRRNIERVAIVDFDVHHGNGTQAVFEDDPSVLYISSHQYPYYPGTGNMKETGTGEGAGTTLNLPLPAGTGDARFQRLYNDILIPAVRRFNPQVMLVSAGYDNHWEDLLASLGLSLTGQAWISQTLVTLAGEVCEGKIVFALEGGYNLNVLEKGVENSVKALLHRDDFEDSLGPSRRREPDLDEYIKEVKSLHHI